MIELLNDVNDFYANKFKKRVRQPKVSIEKLLGHLKDKPEVVSKRLTEEEKENTRMMEKMAKDSMDRKGMEEEARVDMMMVKRMVEIVTVPRCMEGEVVRFVQGDTELYDIAN